MFPQRLNLNMLPGIVFGLYKQWSNKLGSVTEP